MPLTKKNTKHKSRIVADKKPLPEVIIVTKTMMPVNEVSLPKKFKHINEMLAKTTFLPS